MNSFNKALFLCIIFTVIFTMAAGTVYAQIDQGELQRNLAPVTFINYEGPHARIETREQIRQIGVGLGQAVKAGSARTGATSRYFVIHSVSAPDGDKLDADIFGLGANAGVDHVRNLRFIIQGYLQEAYDYSERDAALLAEYVTIYNAVYRGNWDYFVGRYKTPVIGNLNRQNAGLSVRYTEWPGRTLMVIPLGIGGISSIDTSAISDDRVVEEMRKEDDRGVEQRRDMVDLKEREAAAAEQRATTQREAAGREGRAVADERSQLERDRQQTAQDRQQLEEDKAGGAVTPQEARARESELAQRETAEQQKSEELDKREEGVTSQREDAAKQDNFAERKTEEAQRERESIARDQQAIIDRGEQPDGLIGVVLEKIDSVLGRPITIDPAARGQVLRRSPLDTVYVRTLIFVSGKILAIAGENRGNGAIRLIEINGRTLEMAKQGDVDLHPNSLIWVNGGDLYAITNDLSSGTLNLGRFNTDLALQAKSAIAVHPNATVSIQQGSLLTQKADGSPAVLNPADLTEK
jgi:hypothetical protein